ncbi:putative signal transducing protein [Egicoccus halophilus]|uniref:DUF2007 domain-containing protein n=1 Tax=Egicoccus halophilus TaxID=1670830 RepID=A0A8J3ETX0_9ACTN|nr:DUF2007 domain-containing protein [Egicoccus halophilus]GGI06466.1 hypothetical protein GCM10011354_19230 [Egicoccus halophilus]
MARIQRFTSRTEAELARSALESEGIAAYVSGDDAGGLHPEIPYGVGGTAVVVPDEDHARALALLDEQFGTDAADLAALEAAALSAAPAGGLEAGLSRDLAASPPPAGDDAASPLSGRRPVVATLVVAVLVLVLVVALSDALAFAA